MHKRPRRPAKLPLPPEQFTPRADTDDAAQTDEVLIVKTGGSLKYYKTKCADLVAAVALARAEVVQLVNERARHKKDAQLALEAERTATAQRAEEVAKLRKVVYQVHLMTEE